MSLVTRLVMLLVCSKDRFATSAKRFYRGVSAAWMIQLLDAFWMNGGC
jgi:hypothetical protein